MATKIKWGGLAGLVAGLLFLVAAIINQLSPVQRTFDSASYLYLAVVVTGYLAVIIAVLGIHALHSGSPRYGRLGTVGSVMTITGYAIIAVVRLIGMAQGHESLFTVLLIGSALLGVIILRVRLLPWLCGVLLIVAFPPGDVANAIFGSAEEVLLALLWGSIGIALLVRRQSVVESMASQPA